MFELAIFQVINSHMWLAATPFNNADRGFSSSQKVLLATDLEEREIAIGSVSKSIYFIPYVAGNKLHAYYLLLSSQQPCEATILC